jgi:hypothetical protein
MTAMHMQHQSPRPDRGLRRNVLPENNLINSEFRHGRAGSPPQTLKFLT